MKHIVWKAFYDFEKEEKLGAPIRKRIKNLKSELLISE